MKDKIYVGMARYYQHNLFWMLNKRLYNNKQGNPFKKTKLKQTSN